MSDQEWPKNWEHFFKFAKLAASETELRAERFRACELALQLADELCDGLRGDRSDALFHLIDEFFPFMEAEEEVIQKIVREHFLDHYSGDPAKFSIEFQDEDFGKSMSEICTVMTNDGISRFHIKYNQEGARALTVAPENWSITVHPPQIEKLLIFKLFSLLKIGGNVHFILPSLSYGTKSLFIGTEEFPFTRAEQLRKETANARALTLVHFLQVVLLLGDIGTNSTSFGQNDEKPVIIDFWLLTRNCYVLSDEQIWNYWKKSLPCDPSLMADIVKNMTKEEKKEIIRLALEDWKFKEKIEEAAKYVEEFVKENEQRLEVTGNLNTYVNDVKLNIETIMSFF